MKISVVLPCRNEEQSVEICIKKIKQALKGKDYEIIVADSSSDRSAQIAKKQGKNIRVVKHNLIGYGNAILQGLQHAKGEYIIIGDADNTYNFLEIPRLVAELDKGYDLVVGNRLKGKIEPGAMPASHRYLGTPVLNFLIKLFFGKRFSDINSGFRAIKKQALEKLELKTKGMEFASEMLMKAIKNNLKIKEIPITYSKRIGQSKLKTWHDGYKHLRFLLLWSPNFVLLYPGLILVILGFLIMVLTLLEELVLFGFQFQTHPMFIGAALSILGYQSILTGIFAKIYAHNHLNEKNPNLEKLYRFFSLEKGILIGALLFLVGFIIYLYILITWIARNFGALETINIGIIGLTFIIIGIQTIFAGFFFSILGIEK